MKNEIGVEWVGLVGCYSILNADGFIPRRGKSEIQKCCYFVNLITHLCFQYYQWTPLHICLVRQASEMSLTSYGEGFLKKK